MNHILQIATSFTGSKAALAKRESTVWICDLIERKLISEFETILDFGGNRLAISEDGKTCICGAWAREGIAGYDVETGAKIWQRKDLEKVQEIQLVRHNPHWVFTSFEKEISQFLDLRTGETIKSLRNVNSYYENRWHPLAILDRGTGFDIVDRASLARKLSIQRKSWATLDITQSPSSVLISESGKPVHCHDLSTGKLLWKKIPDEIGHYLNLAYSEEQGLFMGTYWPYFEGGDKLLRYIRPDDGEIIDEINLQEPAEAAFAMNGKLLVDSDGEVLDTVKKEFYSLIT